MYSQQACTRQMRGFRFTINKTIFSVITTNSSTVLDVKIIQPNPIGGKRKEMGMKEKTIHLIPPKKFSNRGKGRESRRGSESSKYSLSALKDAKG